MGADVTVKGLLGLETGDGGGLGKKDGWLALRGETTITSLELAPAEKKTTENKIFSFCQRRDTDQSTSA